MIRYIFAFLLTLALLPVQAQSEIEVDWSAYAQDTVVPVFTHSIDLGYDHIGHEYSVAIEYPELKPLTASEIERYRLPQENGLPEWPEIDVYKGISAKRGQLDISFIPIIWRDGKYWRMENFVLRVSPSSRQVARVAQADEKNGSQLPITNSLLEKGRWVKIRVSDNGVHMLTHARLKSMGFADPTKVRLFGYGGHMLSEGDTDTWIDDLCEVPLWRGSDRVLFYANGPVKWTLESDNTFTHTRNPYSEYGYYFLTDNLEGTPASFPCEEEIKAVDSEIATTPAYSIHEVDDYVWFHGGR